MVLLEMLEDLDFLKGISPDHLGHVIALGELREYAPGTVLFQQGRECCFVHLILSGEVALELDGEVAGAVAIQMVGPGELLGCSPMLRLGPMTATARTVSRFRLVRLNVRRMWQRCEEAPQFGMEFLRRTAATMFRRLSATRRRLLSLAAGQDGPTRCVG